MFTEDGAIGSSRWWGKPLVAVLVTGMLFSGWMVVSGALAGKNDRSTKKRSLVANAVIQPRAGSPYLEDEGLIYYGRQPDGRKGIIAILIGLKPDQTYQLGLRKRGCGNRGGGIFNSALGGRLVFTADAEGTAYLKYPDIQGESSSAKISQRHLRKVRSAVLLTRDTGNRFQGCGTMQFSFGNERE